MVDYVVSGAPNGALIKVNIEVSALQFFYFYLAKCTPAQVFDSWNSLAQLLRDCLQLAPPAIFLALAILNQFVHRSPGSEKSDKKEQKELQELTSKLVDECARIGGLCTVFIPNFIRIIIHISYCRFLSGTNHLVEEEFGR